MPRTGSLAGIAISVLFGVSSGFAQGVPPTRVNAAPLRQATQQGNALIPQAPTGPLAQVPLDQLPATAPRITYQAGLLSIVAENSTLGDVLREVRKHTGAEIDVPPSANERVVVKLGPGPARDVLADLLNGTSFNYVMAGSPSDPTGLASVMLTPKPAGGTPAGNQTVESFQSPANRIPGMGPNFAGRPVIMQQAIQTNQGQTPAAASDANADNADDDTADADDTADEDQNQNQPGQVESGQTAPPPNAGPKTPEQIMEMLRRPAQTPPGQTPDNSQQENSQQPPD